MGDEELLKSGLSAEQVTDRISRGQVNGSHNAKTKSVRQIILGNTCTLFNLINGLLAACVAFVGSYKNMLFMGVIVSNVFIGIIQEIRAKRVIDKLSLISAPKVKVLRNGVLSEIAMEDIVLDELLVLKMGDQICADAKLISGVVEVDESLLTGENEPVQKKPGDELLSGSFLVSGNGRARAIHVGEDNYAYKIVHEAKFIKKPSSEMMDAINKIIKTISFCLIPFAVILFYKQFFILDQTFDKAVINTVAAIIAMIPEGLMLLTSIVLAVSVVRLSREKTLVQELYCIETLARVNTLCLDKTGTITEGKMELERIINIDSTIDLEEALSAMMGVLDDGNPTFEAVKERCCALIGWEVSDVKPFSSAKKCSSVTFKDKGTFVLGAAEFILSEKELKPYIEMINKYSNEGYRILMLAYSKGKAEPGDGGLRPAGILLLSDKIRKEAKDTLDFFAAQGVKLKIISGDHPATVAQVARKAGLIGSDNYVDATTLKTDEDLKQAAGKYTIFGRVTPHQKLGLVKALKAKGDTVGMTGDGVNDVLALKESDCSVAMQSGSDAARNVSKLVLLNSNFASMPKVVAEGRRSINNLERSATLFLVKTVYAFLLALIFVFLNKPYPFAPIQLTLVSALTIGIPSFLLALEPNYNLVKGNFLKNVMTSALPGGLLSAANVVMTVLLSGLAGATAEQTATLATVMIAMVSFTVLFRICRPWNIFRAVLYVVLVSAFVIAMIFFGDIFMITEFTLPMYAIIVGQTVATVMLIAPLTRLVKAVIQKIEERNKRKK